MKLKFKAVDLQLAHRWAIAKRQGSHLHHVIIVELVDDDGITGLGEAAPSVLYGETIATATEFFNKTDAGKLSFADVAGSMNYLQTRTPHQRAAICALNIALLDGAAKLARKPVYDFLGLGFRENHHVTSFSIGIDAPEMIRQKVLEAEKYPVLKLKIGDARDRKNFAALRAAAPEKTVRVDANEGWKTKEQALQMIEWLAQDGKVEFVEQPMPRDADAKDLTWLKKRSPLPLFADESYHLAGDIARCAECFHGVNVKLVKTGGISAAYDALQAARRAGLKTMIGCMIETSVLISAAAHLAELADFLDIDGNLLITNDPYAGVTAEKGILSFARADEKFGLRVNART
jgi:L-alanine-DL-glutamate epimerase-like enolase superfamily enzyme